MNIDTNAIASVTEANQIFSRVTRIAEKHGQAVPLIDIENSPVIDMTDDEMIDFVALRILKKHKEAFLELAK